MNDLYEFAPELGLPSREELLGYVDVLGDVDFATKLLIFQAVIVVEKITLVGEFLPLGIVLPAIWPLLCGGVGEKSEKPDAAASKGSSAAAVGGRRMLLFPVADVARERAVRAYRCPFSAPSLL